MGRQPSGDGDEIVQFLHDGGEPVAAKQGFGAGTSALERERRVGENTGIERNIFRLAHGGRHDIAQQAQEPRLIGIDAAGMFGNPDIEGALDMLLASGQFIESERRTDEIRERAGWLALSQQSKNM